MSNTDVITKIKNTFHTAGINSFSMYRYLTQPVDGIPEHTQKTRYQDLSFIFQNLIRKISLTKQICKNFWMLNIMSQILVLLSAISSLTLSTQTDFSNTNTCCRARLPSCITFQIKMILRLQFPHLLRILSKEICYLLLSRIR